MKRDHHIPPGPLRLRYGSRFPLLWLVILPLLWLLAAWFFSGPFL